MAAQTSARASSPGIAGGRIEVSAKRLTDRPDQGRTDRLVLLEPHAIPDMLVTQFGKPRANGVEPIERFDHGGERVDDLARLHRQVDVEQPPGRWVQLEQPAVEEQGHRSRQVAHGVEARGARVGAAEESSSARACCERSLAIARRASAASTSCISRRCGSPNPGSDWLARQASRLLPSHDRASFRSLAARNGLRISAAYVNPIAASPRGSARSGPEPGGGFSPACNARPANSSASPRRPRATAFKREPLIGVDEQNVQ